MNTLRTPDASKKNRRYIVFNVADVEKYFHPSEKEDLDRLCALMEFRRCYGDKKPSRSIVVVERDQPE